ncbi:MAG: ATP-binding cassette domain-containing protein [Bacillota bacterium]|jgi:ABC-2 type transport system ATP-binding protein|nr:ABC transporter ATP-binding protein [Bacillota bacterium]
MIKVDNLRVQYGDFVAVDDISFSVAPQEIFGIIGPNGAGKTSAIECIEGLRRPYSGEVSVLGLNPWKDRKELHQLIGVQLQDTAYQDNARVWELCQLFSALYPNPAPYQELLETMGLEEKKKSFISSLSGGERQKLSIVLALIPNPKLVFLDELTTGLDPHARHQMWDLLLQLRAGGLTIVIISHFMDEVEAICDRVGVMENGRLVTQGPVSQVSNKFNLGSKITFTAPQLQAGELDGISNVTSVSLNHGTVTVLCQGEDCLPEILTYLRDKGIPYSNLSVTRPGLEEVFLKLVEQSKAQSG